MVFMRGGKCLILGGASSGVSANVYLVDGFTGNEVGVWNGHINDVRSLACDPSSGKLACGSSSLPGPSGIKICAVAGLEQERGVILDSYGNIVRALAFSSDGRHLFADKYNEIAVFDSETLLEVNRLRLNDQVILRWSMCPDGKYFAVAARGSRVYTAATKVLIGVFESDNLRKVREFVVDGEGVQALALTPRGETLALALEGENYIWLWDVRSGKRKRVIKGLRQPVSCLALSSDGRWLAAADVSGTVKGWNLAKSSSEERQTQTGTQTTNGAIGDILECRCLTSVNH